MTHRFRTVIEAATGGGAAAQIPPDVTVALGGLKQMRVAGTLNGHPIRTSTMPYRGAFYVGCTRPPARRPGADRRRGRPRADA